MISILTIKTTGLLNDAKICKILLKQNGYKSNIITYNREQSNITLDNKFKIDVFNLI